MHGCTHLSRFALVSRVFSGRNAKKYTGYCIIACVPMWLRGWDLNHTVLHFLCGENAAVGSAALTVHRTVIHYRDLRFATLHRGAGRDSVKY